MYIKNCRIIYENRIEEGSILIKDKKIVKINPLEVEDDNIIDANGLYLSPGFIDIHIHGAGGYDTMDGSYNAIKAIAKTIAAHGTTSFLPTTMTASGKETQKALEAISEAKNKGTGAANVLGAHLEGPFINQEMMGAQNPKYIVKPSIDNFNDIVGDNLSVVTSVTLAPELDGAPALIKYLSEKGIVVSVGHSNAKYYEVIKAINNGLSHSTHLFNAMSAFKHREPGVVGAIFDTDITTETICDGIHVAYPALRVVFKQKSIDKVILVTDAMMACGIKEGIYSLGGQKVLVEGGHVRLENGALAGSVLTLDNAVRNIYKNSNYELYEIVKMVTINAAKHCKVHNSKGLIKENYDADLILFDDNIDIKTIIIGGSEVK